MSTLLKSWIANTLSLWLLDVMLSGIAFSDMTALLATGLVLGILNATIKPLLKVISLPVTVLTLGLFSLIINALVLELAFNLIGGTYISSFGTAIWAALLLGILNAIFGN